MGWVSSGFYVDLCKALELPATANRLDSFTYHQVAEGPNRGEHGAAHNPFNVTLDLPGSTPFNDNGGVPVRNYRSRAQGVEATAHVLKQANYASVLKALTDNADPYYYAVAVDRAGQWTNGWLFCQVLHDHGVGVNG